MKKIKWIAQKGKKEKKNENVLITHFPSIQTQTHYWSKLHENHSTSSTLLKKKKNLILIGDDIIDIPPQCSYSADKLFIFVLWLDHYKHLIWLENNKTRSIPSISQLQSKSLEAGIKITETPARHKVMRFLEHHRSSRSWMATLVLFILETFSGSMDRSKLAPLSLSSCTHIVSARSEPLSVFSSFFTLWTPNNLICTAETKALEVISESAKGTHHRAHRSRWRCAQEEEVNNSARKKKWKAKKRQHRWKTSRLKFSSWSSRTATR